MSSSQDPDLSTVLRTLSAFSRPPPNHPRKSVSPASSITTWPAALKHVMYLTSQNADFSGRIRHLIKSQQDHERSWWKAREALLAKQAARDEKKKQLEQVLRSVGASNSATQDNEMTSKEEYATELKAYDSKVYHASADMSRAMETELRKLGVPFFCLDANLILSDEGESTTRTAKIANISAASAKNNSESKISTAEVEALKKRIIDLLVDLCS